MRKQVQKYTEMSQEDQFKLALERILATSSITVAKEIAADALDEDVNEYLEDGREDEDLFNDLEVDLEGFKTDDY